MGYLTAKQFSEKWEITERRIIKLCKENRINGAIKNGMVWLIPEDTLKPSDRRQKVAQYINTQKRIMVVNINNQIGYQLIPLLKKEGYIVEGTYEENKPIDEKELNEIQLWKSSYKNRDSLEKLVEETEKYYDGCILIDIKKTNKTERENKEFLVKAFAKKMNCESAVILVNDLENAKLRLEEKLANPLKEEIGLRINAITINIPIENRVVMNYNQIAEDIIELLTKFKNTTGNVITTDGGAIRFNQSGRTNPLKIGEFYKAINTYFKSLNKQSYMWCASTMLEDEWTEEPAEMNFRVNNIEAANRGANLERIFIFTKDKIKEFRENKTLKIYMQSNIKTMFVDYNEIKSKEPELLEIVAEGWDGINQDTLIVDLPSGNKQRGYISINKDEVQKAYQCFQKLKSYAKDLKEILK